MQQVFEAAHYASKAKGLGYPDQFQSMEGMLEFLAYFRGALVAYAKCFVSAGPGKMTLDESKVFQRNAAHMAMHKRLMDLRHKYVAHSDDNEIEKSLLVEEEGDSEVVVALQYSFSFPFDRLYELCDAVSHLETYIVDGHAAAVKSLERQVGKPVRMRQVSNDNSEQGCP